jgi:hypothetical protein
LQGATKKQNCAVIIALLAAVKLRDGCDEIMQVCCKATVNKSRVMSFLEKVLAIIGKVVSDQRQSEWQTVERKDIHVGGQDYIHIVHNWRSQVHTRKAQVASGV